MRQYRYIKKVKHRSTIVVRSTAHKQMHWLYADNYVSQKVLTCKVRFTIIVSRNLLNNCKQFSQNPYQILTK